MVRGLAGKRVCVTGASRGIGAHACGVFARAGAQVMGLARSIDDLTSLHTSLQAEGLSFRFAKIDLLADDAIPRLDDLFANFVPDVFINNAGATRPAPFEAVSVEDFDRVMGLNLRAGFFASQAAVRAMLAAPPPEPAIPENARSVLHLSSMLGHVALPGRSVYAATKHALEGLTKAMALDLATLGIRVNALGPTYIETPLTEALLREPEFRQFAAARMPLSSENRPIGTLSDLDGALLYLADSTLSALVTGTSVVIDGGWTAQ